MPNFGLFLPSQILGGGPSKNCTYITMSASRHIAWKCLWRYSY